ncbi:MAG TPA: hypothetical protein DCQ25_09000 [Elusimicrobia bacterium]|nr:hypothetical protein [Elusimicrobiota bacterium]
MRGVRYKKLRRPFRTQRINMETIFIKELIYNICLLLGVGVVYSEVSLRSATPRRYRDVAIGVVLGLVGVAVMLNPWTMRPGMVFDVRSILLSVAGVFFGPVAAFLSAGITAAFRFNVGGDGVWMGVAVIFVSAGLGVLWRRFRPQIALNPGFGELALFGLAVHLAMLLCTVLLPAGTALETLKRIALPVLLVYPAGTVLFSLLFLRHAERERLMRAIEQSSESVLITDAAGGIQYVNPAFERITGYSRAEVTGKTPKILKSGGHGPEFYRELWSEISAGKRWEGRMLNRRKGGGTYTEEVVISAVRDAGGRIVNYVSVRRDITEALRLEEQFRQAQKMEAVGQLAGGVAHDFNNILTAIKGYCSLLAPALPERSRAREDAAEILAAAEKATSLTRQLLAFSRKQIMVPRVVDLNKIIGDMIKMLRRLIGEEVSLTTRLHHAPCLVKVDPGQIEQVILNLVLNARDALNGKGEIALETLVRGLSDNTGAAVKAPGGKLVCLKVRDNGCGMSDEIRGHLFEPFYTTKGPAKGTGLGLSVVFGVIKQSGGEVEVESSTDKGSVFTLCFPAAAPEEAGRAPAVVAAAVQGGGETVLIVEDEETLRRLGERVLSDAGYLVLGASSADEAMEVMERRKRPVDLLVTDVVMPGRSGRELALELARRKLCPRTLYMSGYTDEAIVKHGVLEPGIAFLYKPFSPGALETKVREVLDGPEGQARA